MAVATKKRQKVITPGRASLSSKRLAKLLENLYACKVPTGENMQKIYRNASDRDIAWMGLSLDEECACVFCTDKILAKARKLYPYNKLMRAALAYCRKHGIK